MAAAPAKARTPGIYKRRSQYLLITVGALFLIAAAAGFILVPEHAPSTQQSTVSPVNGYCPGSRGTFVPTGFACPGPSHATGLSHTAYDALRIATWAVLIVGLLVVLMTLIHEGRRELN